MASWCSLPFYHGDLYHGIWDWIELTIKESNINCTCPIQLKHFRKGIQHEPCCLGLQYCRAKPVAGCLLGGLRRWHLATFAVLQRACPERWGCSESVSCASMDTCEKEYMMVAVTVIHTCDIFMRHYYCTWKMGRFWEAALDGMSAQAMIQSDTISKYYLNHRYSLSWEDKSQNTDKTVVAIVTTQRFIALNSEHAPPNNSTLTWFCNGFSCFST